MHTSPSLRHRPFHSALVAGNCLLIACLSCASAETAGDPGRNDLVIAQGGKSDAVVVVAPGDAKRFEAMAAADLVKYIELMSGAKPAVATNAEAITAALAEKSRPVLIIGTEALKAQPDLAKALEKVAKKTPILRADAIVVRRDDNRVYFAGLTDDGHYHAVAELLHRWGCRWYVPTDFGECIPEQKELKIGKLDYAYASPFEMRNYWGAWNGSYEGKLEFTLRNRMAEGVPAVGGGHNLGAYTAELIPTNKTIMNIPIAEDKTAAHVAAKLDGVFSSNGVISLAMEDGTYDSDSPVDLQLRAKLQDKYFMTSMMTDVFMTFYNKVCDILIKKYPNSKARIGFLAYSNMTVPPQKVRKAAKPLFCSFAPIDIDPNHGMDDPRSPSRQEYREMLYRWADVMEGRVWIYDYDQGMLVWRDIPNPSHQAFRKDVQHYRKAGILGVSTETRMAFATIFLNVFFRGQLMWNPDFDVDQALTEFYPKFYGPAAEPMQRYWGAIYKAWEDTIITEHEFFTAPAIYTPELIAGLRKNLEAGEKAVASLKDKTDASRNEKLYVERIRFTRLSYEVLANYMDMVFKSASDCDYKAATEAGKKALAARKELAQMNPTFCTRVVGPAAEPEYGGSPAWFPGEPKYFEELAALTDGTQGTLVQALPLEWSFRRDPNDTGMASGWAYKPVDLAFWNANEGRFSEFERKDYPVTQWEVVRADLYPQAQGILHPDGQSFVGYSWYRTGFKLNKADAAKAIHVRFPGLFAEAWLYVNGQLVSHREQGPLWWMNDYSFGWDVDLTGALQSGENTITIRNRNVHHVSGMFRRPFLYVPTGAK